MDDKRQQEFDRFKMIFGYEPDLSKQARTWKKESDKELAKRKEEQEDMRGQSRITDHYALHAKAIDENTVLSGGAKEKFANDDA